MVTILEAKQRELKIFESLLELDQLTLPESMKNWINGYSFHQLIDIWVSCSDKLPSEVNQYFESLSGNFCDADAYYDGIGNIIARAKLYEMKKYDIESDITWMEKEEKFYEVEMQLVAHLKKIDALKKEIYSLETKLSFLKQEIPGVPDFMKEWLNSAPLYELINNWYRHYRLPKEVKEYLSRFYGDYDDNVAWEKIGNFIARAKLYESEYGYYKFFGKVE